jgi:hypothetical protein
MFAMRICHGAGQRVLAMCGLASIALLGAACSATPAPAAHKSGKTVTVVQPSPTHTATVTPTPTATPRLATGPGQCSTSDLKVTIGQENGAAGTIYYPVQFTNVSASACTLYGYPGVAFVTQPGGSVIGAPAGRRTSARVLITIGPGVTAHATLAVSDVLIGDNCHQHQVPVHWLQVYPPNQYTALTVPFSAPNGVGCADKSLVVMGVTTVTWGSAGP